jgi:plasmid stabilization system protein ParE
MKVEYAPRATADLIEIGERSRRVFGDPVAGALETYIRATVARLAFIPELGQRLPEREGIRVIPLIRYPFKIFYTVSSETITILHIRHAARRPWEGK